ncbi:C-C motif chemokine 8-like [Danio aesculapii]|uniref:C-C motif chemokine 8-like n=1 Tax=Danio aesculapii TaxID=1142201 RepID=UPI0024BF39DF|nr:C-C motif chemokine 8-like [Danio aesculapii]
MKIIMKTALLFAVLCCALLPQSSDGQPLSGDASISVCCFGKGSNSRIPLNRLESYYWTSSICPFRHIVLVTTAKRHFCMNPENEWVKKSMKAIDKKPGSNSPK